MNEMLVDIDSLSNPNDDAYPVPSYHPHVSNTSDIPHVLENGPYAYAHYRLDCYPYSFSPLLLFTSSHYFDKGYSNYNAVVGFFDEVLQSFVDNERSEHVTFESDTYGNRGLSEEETISRRKNNQSSPDCESGCCRSMNRAGIDMLDGVVYERKNMTYDDLFKHVVLTQSIVICCIDSHFTAFHVIDSKTLLYYDPLNPMIRVAKGDNDVQKIAVFLLLKCNYGDNQHIQENKNHYMGAASSGLQRTIYQLWNKINSLEMAYLSTCRWQGFPLNLDKYLFINNPQTPSSMSTQLTGNTCYFQTFLFALLCKIGRPKISPHGHCINLQNQMLLEQATIRIARFLLTFFVDNDRKILRPLTNNNFVLDFHRYKDSPYYAALVRYLTTHKVHVPSYHSQYKGIMTYYVFSKILHGYDKFILEGATTSSHNTKSLQFVQSTDGAAQKVARGEYYKYRAANMMFGCNAGAMQGISNFAQFNSWRKNQLLSFHDVMRKNVHRIQEKISIAGITKYRDYYFMPQFEVGQQELVDIHHYTYLMDMCAMNKASGLADIVYSVNKFLVQKIYFSTQSRNNYHKMMDPQTFVNARKYMNMFQKTFLTTEWFRQYIGLGFSEINPKDKEINALTQTVFYDIDMIKSMSYRQDHEFEKECVNQMARTNVRRFTPLFEDGNSPSEMYEVIINIGQGFTYSKYNTLMHFLGVVKGYWSNPDINNIQVFGKDIRSLLAVSCQKIFFEPGHCGYYFYGPLELRLSGAYDLAVASNPGSANAKVSATTRAGCNHVMIVDRVYEFSYMKGLLEQIFRTSKKKIKSDNGVLNLLLLSLMLDFGLYEEYAKLLNIPFMKDLQHEADTRELQVEVANLIYDFDRKHTADPVTRSKVEELIYEVSYKFLVNKNFPIQSHQFKLIQILNSDSDYQEYVLLCKIYMSLCQINKSVEVDYYKMRCNGVFHVVIPHNFSKVTSGYLENITRYHSFSENEGIMFYDNIQVFNLRPHQPEINLYRVRLESSTDVQSMVKFIEITNVFRSISTQQDLFLVFIGDNSILIDVLENGVTNITINQAKAEISTIFFNEAISFIPCFKYCEGGEDIIIFTSGNLHYHIDTGGQFCSDYFGMKIELMECINSDEIHFDLNDDVSFQRNKLSELLTESKMVVYFPDYLLLVSSRQQLINLLDFSSKIRNVSFFILVLSYLRRTSINLEFIEKKDQIIQISGPWKEAILYALNGSVNEHYEEIFHKQFFDLDQHTNIPLPEFIDLLCENFTRYQRYTEDGRYQIVPTEKQKKFLERIIRGGESFHFSEVGSGKTKVIMPLLCQTFLSSNIEAHKCIARGGKSKDTLVILVPEHLVNDARTQVFRHCLNLNFRQEYRVYDDIFALLHSSVQLGGKLNAKTGIHRIDMKQIFVTSFNQFKKALTYDNICQKIRPHRDKILVIADEVDDFLDRDKLVFNICSNKANSFNVQTIEFFHEVSYAAYHGLEISDDVFHSSSNPPYWMDLYKKCVAIHKEIQDASKSLNKSFGIFNENTLRHCKTSISHDIDGYKALIARPYESVNRAMPGSYYSDVERTVYLTFVILSEDIEKYDELFQGERKFISFEYWKQHLSELDFDDLVYGHDRLSEIAAKHPRSVGGLIRFLYVIILKRMEIRDGSRSVNSVDITFNFDMIGFTGKQNGWGSTRFPHESADIIVNEGTPFLDNYPTADYFRHKREDEIPPVIDRSFYAYTNEDLSSYEFERRFSLFQGINSNVKVTYASSDFMQDSLKIGEMKALQTIFEQEQHISENSGGGSNFIPPFNVIVDLCGIFKLSSIYDVKSLVSNLFGLTGFHYIYHIDQSNGSDRMLCIRTNNDVAFDEEFYKYLSNTYGASLSNKIFFFIDNRNYIGKDVPYQLGYQRQFKNPLFFKSVVIAHDVHDFSKIWQAMGRSRTMNETVFTVYKKEIPLQMVSTKNNPNDIKTHPLTKLLYTRNCDSKTAGNLSSIYQTLIALYNLSEASFYYKDDIVNAFIEKMERTIQIKVDNLEDKIAKITANSITAHILKHIFTEKFRRSSDDVIAQLNELAPHMVDNLSRQIIRQKFEQRIPSLDIFDDLIRFLSGEQVSLMEISYTKQQQKQKQKQKSKSQDNDTMDVFHKKNQLIWTTRVDNYFESTVQSNKDEPKNFLSLPLSIPILSMYYWDDKGKRNTIKVYPTVQFLYSHYIKPSYIDDEVRNLLRGVMDPSQFCADFLTAVTAHTDQDMVSNEKNQIHEVTFSCIRQNPQYSLVGIQPGIYLVGMKDQFNIFDCATHPLNNDLQFASDEIGFILFDKTETKNVDEFGPYFIEQYLLLDALSKQEVAQNVIMYYREHKEVLVHCLGLYDEKQGKGFVSWRFLMNQALL